MGPSDRTPNTDGNLLVTLAFTHGFICSQNEQGVWTISPAAKEQETAANQQPAWHLQQQGDRWMLFVQGTPQILLRTAEAIAFINRQAHSR